MDINAVAFNKRAHSCEFISFKAQGTLVCPAHTKLMFYLKIMCTVTHMEFSYQAYKKCRYINENAIAYICCNKTAKHLNLKGSQTKLYHSQHIQAAALTQTHRQF